MGYDAEKCDNLLIELRKIIRAIDLHSKQLLQKYGLTGPQALLLKMICYSSHDTQITSSELAKKVSLSQATITSIVDRLYAKGYIQRKKSLIDKRKSYIVATNSGLEVIKQCPTLLQETFVQRFEQLKEWEQSLLLSSLERIAEMMQAEKIDASPLLTSEDINEETSSDSKSDTLSTHKL